MCNKNTSVQLGFQDNGINVKRKVLETNWHLLLFKGKYYLAEFQLDRFNCIVLQVKTPTFSQFAFPIKLHSVTTSDDI